MIEPKSVFFFENFISRSCNERRQSSDGLLGEGSSSSPSSRNNRLHIPSTGGDGNYQYFSASHHCEYLPVYKYNRYYVCETNTDADVGTKKTKNMYIIKTHSFFFSSQTQYVPRPVKAFPITAVAKFRCKTIAIH